MAQSRPAPPPTAPSLGVPHGPCPTSSFRPPLDTTTIFPACSILMSSIRPQFNIARHWNSLRSHPVQHRPRSLPSAARTLASTHPPDVSEHPSPHTATHESHYDPPSGWLFGEEPGKKYEKEGWENTFVYGFWGSLLFGVVAYAYKPDTSIQTWALEEARRRLEAEGILSDPDDKGKH